MPELPEVEAICRKLREEISGRKIVAARILRPGIVKPQGPDEIESTLAGRTIRGIERRAKNILIALSGGRVLHIHLRMTGNLYVVPDVRFRPNATRAYLEFANGRTLIFEDQRALGRWRVFRGTELRKALGKLGPEPLSKDFTADWLAEAARRSRKPAKLFLMDQTSIAGLGNIYAAEALFRAGIHPSRAMNRLRRRRLDALHAAIVHVLETAVQSACNAYSRPGGFSEAESFPCFVYDREGARCFVCGRKIRRMAQGGRSTYFCPGCQT
jgi:formamidopyrimidine-DNA glycosylase